jgi:hypothetical protein
MHAGLALIFILIINAGIIALIFFAIKYLINYSHKLKKAKSQQQTELERMNVEDL